MERGNEGWISLHRKIKKHWLWKSSRRFQWWIDILLTVNYSDQKVLIKGNLIECKRGQSVRSLDTWAKEWNVSKGAVRDFFKLLQEDFMINTENLKYTTRITVCNYDKYQEQLYVEQTWNKRRGYTNNNENNENNSLSEKVNSVFTQFLEEQKKPLSNARKNILIENLERYAPGDDVKKVEIIKQAIAGGYPGFRPLPTINEDSGNSKLEIKTIPEDAK